MELFVLYNKYMPKKYTSKDLLIQYSWGIFGALLKSELRQLTWSMIYTNQATSLTREIALKSVVGLVILVLIRPR